MISIIYLLGFYMKLSQCKNEKYDIIILAGQSNAEGCGLGEVENEFVPNERIHNLLDNATYSYKKYEDGRDYLDLICQNEKTIEIAEEKLNENKQKLGSLMFNFARKYIADGRLKEDRKILLINAGIGGSGFYRPEWGVGNLLYNRLVELTETALSLNKENRVVAFLWHQGEHDTFEGRAFSFEEKYRWHYFRLRKQIETFYNKFNISVPFITAEFCQEWYEKDIPTNESILKAIKDVACDLKGEVVETKDLLSNNQEVNNEDDIHFSRKSQYILGERFYDAFVKCLNK